MKETIPDRHRDLVATVLSISPTDPFHTLEVRATVEIADDDAQRTFMAS